MRMDTRSTMISCTSSCTLPTGTMYDRYYQMFVGTDYYWNHYGDYRNPEFVDL